MAQTQEQIKKDLSLRRKIDMRVINAVIGSQFQFTKRRMSDDTDLRPVRLRYLCSVQPKYKILNGGESETTSTTE